EVDSHISKLFSISDFLFIISLMNLEKREENLDKYGDIVYLLRIAIIMKIFENHPDVSQQRYNLQKPKIHNSEAYIRTGFNIMNERTNQFGCLYIGVVYNDINNGCVGSESQFKTPIEKHLFSFNEKYWLFRTLREYDSTEKAEGFGCSIQ